MTINKRYRSTVSFLVSISEIYPIKAVVKTEINTTKWLDLAPLSSVFESIRTTDANKHKKT